RQTETHRADLCVRRRAERRAAAAENLRGGQELGVNLQTDYGFKDHTGRTWVSWRMNELVNSIANSPIHELTNGSRRGPRGANLGVDGRFEGLEVVGEHAREVGCLRVV